jgi:transposase-like protein
MECPHCQSEKTVKNGKDYHQDGKAIQNYLCNGCGKRFNERTGTPMSRLRTPASIVSFALKMRTEGMGIRASGRVLEKSHTSIMRWEQKLAAQTQQWSPCAPAGGDITIEGDEVYTRVGENLSPLGVKRMDSDIHRT